MTAATIDAPETTRRTPAARRPPTNRQPALVEARAHTEAAVTDLVTATTNAARSLVPGALVHPTEAVEYIFDLAEQLLAGCRRISLETAELCEDGLDGVNRRAA